MLEAQTSHKQSMIHLEPAELLAVLRSAKPKGAREWARGPAGTKVGTVYEDRKELMLDAPCPFCKL